MTKGILRGSRTAGSCPRSPRRRSSIKRALEKRDKESSESTATRTPSRHDLEILRVSHEVEIEQVKVLGSRRTDRDPAAVHEALERMVALSRTDANMIPVMLDACPRRGHSRRDL